jgi:hypothetical protein
MRIRLNAKRRGQALIMVTFSLITLCGMLGLVVDLGWAYFTKRSAQSAADVAALAAVKMVFSGSGATSDTACSFGNITCALTPIPCPATGNLQSACLYAQQQGFSNSQRQSVTVQASDRVSAPTVVGCNPVAHQAPTAPCVDTYYWVTVRITERVPQLFSAVMGHTEATVAARATAGVVKTQGAGQLRLINRENDPWGLGAPGNTLHNLGGPTLFVPGGVQVASAANGTGDQAAAFLGGNSLVESPFTSIRTGGRYDLQGNAQWVAAPVSANDGPQFKDPFSDRYRQPPILNGPHTPHPALGGVINHSVCPGGMCGEGLYYATGPQPNCSSNCQIVATGRELTLARDVTFASGSFGQYVFFGGLHTEGKNVNFGPGQYVLAGTKGPSTPLLEIDNKSLIQGGNGADAGRIFILTDSKYPGLESRVATVSPRYWPGPDNSLTFAMSSIKTGNNSGSRIDLYGLTDRTGNLPSGLEPFVPVLFWQDQLNSYVKYTADSQVSQCPDLAHPCMNASYPGLASSSPQFEMWATPFTSLRGAIYQPRGAWMLLQASGVMQGPLQVVTGAAKFQGSGTLSMSGVNDPIFVYGAALIE